MTASESLTVAAPPVPPPTAPTMNDAFDIYERVCIPELQWRSQRDYRGIIIILRAAFGHMAIQDVRPRHVAEFIDVPKGRVHRNRMVTILSTVFKKCMGRWYLDLDLTNPCTVVERWKTEPRERYITDAEFSGMRAICPPQLQMAMDLALLTGQRQGDIVSLKWEKLIMDGPRPTWFIDITQSKTGKHLGVTISPAIEEVFDRAVITSPPGDYVIRTQFGTRYSEDGFRAMWQKYMRRWIARGNENFHFHDIRAKSISDTKDLMSASLRAGHMDPKLTRRVYDRNIRMVEPLR
jgi:integrase